MEPLDVFSVRDLRTRSGDLLKDAEAGQLTLAQAAKLAGLSLDAFMDLLAPLGLAAVDYPAAELTEELDAAL